MLLYDDLKERCRPAFATCDSRHHTWASVGVPSQNSFLLAWTSHTEGQSGSGGQGS